MKRFTLKPLVCAIALGTLAFSGTALAQKKPLRVGMTLSDIPTTTGQPNGGGEGNRMTGITLYDGMINWKLDDAKGPSTLVPGLATEWNVDPKDPTRWIFKLRKGVKFHDGSDFTADAVVWNLDKLYKKEVPQYDARQAAQVIGRVLSLKGWRKIDDYTVELTTYTADSTFPYQVSYVYYSSPAQFEKLGRDWNKFAVQPSGTGPFKLDKLVPRERIEMVRNPGYWDPKRIPKTERLILLPIPEATTRASALLSGQVDFIEVPPPDFVPRLKAQGFVVTSNIYPHYWPYYMSFREGSPWRDLRVRKAVNLAIDRDGIVKLLGGLAEPAKGIVDESSPWFGKPQFKVKYDPATAKKLLAEAGYGPSKPLHLKILISPSGSGQMLPKPMNEYIQQNLKQVGINLELVTVDWEGIRNCRRAGAGSPPCHGTDGINNSSGTADPFSAFTRVYSSKSIAPKGWNYMYYSDPKVDAMIDKAMTIFDEKKRDVLLGEIHAYLVDNAVDVWVVHDTGPRAMSAKVRGWTQAKNWFQDLAPVYVAD
jgi:peptide/nickel transport system substrate-binding protein